MTDKETELVDMLWEVKNIETSEIVGIVNPLKTEKQAQQLIDWLNEQDLTMLKITPIFKKMHEIVGR